MPAYKEAFESLLVGSATLTHHKHPSHTLQLHTSRVTSVHADIPRVPIPSHQQHDLLCVVTHPAVPAQMLIHSCSMIAAPSCIAGQPRHHGLQHTLIFMLDIVCSQHLILITAYVMAVWCVLGPLGSRCGLPRATPGCSSRWRCTLLHTTCSATSSSSSSTRAITRGPGSYRRCVGGGWGHMINRCSVPGL